MRSQAQGILALDFFTADLLNGTKAHVLATIEHDTRPPTPDLARWVKLTRAFGGQDHVLSILA